MQIGMGFWASKVMLAAVKFKLFTLLAGTKNSGKPIKETLQLGTADRHVRLAGHIGESQMFPK